MSDAAPRSNGERLRLLEMIPRMHPLLDQARLDAVSNAPPGKDAGQAITQLATTIAVTLARLDAYMRAERDEREVASMTDEPQIDDKPCPCSGWARQFAPLMTEHHMTCRHVDQEIAGVMRDLLIRIDRWAGEEDGIPDFAADAYDAMARMIGHRPIQGEPGTVIAKRVKLPLSDWDW